MSVAMAEEAAVQVAEKAAGGRLTLGIGDNLLDALLGYLVVFIGLTLLMTVVIIVGMSWLRGQRSPSRRKRPFPRRLPLRHRLR